MEEIKFFQIIWITELSTFKLILQIEIVLNLAPNRDNLTSHCYSTPNYTTVNPKRGAKWNLHEVVPQIAIVPKRNQEKNRWNNQEMESPPLHSVIHISDKPKIKLTNVI